MKLFIALATGSIFISAMPAFADDNYGWFTTPSKNIWCAKRVDFDTSIPLAVECDVDNHDWKNWIQDDDLNGYHGNRFMIPGTGPAEAIGSSDTMVGSAAPVLQYGQKVTFSHRPEDGTITCLSEKIGLTCTNKSGGLMHLNREFYVLNKPVPR